MAEFNPQTTMWCRTSQNRYYSYCQPPETSCFLVLLLLQESEPETSQCG
jgi:hypothetical protein